MIEKMAEGVRRVPAQARSRERQERILKIAEELIAEFGSEALRMNALAERAGISIGSLYQYYKDKGAVLSALAEHYHAEGTACIAAELRSADGPEALVSAFDRLTDIYFGMFRARPAMRDVWTAIQSDKALRDIEITASRRNGALLLDAIRRCSDRPYADREVSAAFTIMALGEAAMRLAVALDQDEAEEVVATYKRMAKSELLAATQAALE